MAGKMDAFTRCVSCGNDYDTDSKLPHELKCRHILCSDCLKTILLGDKKCKECHNVINYTSTIEVPLSLTMIRGVRFRETIKSRKNTSNKQQQPNKKPKAVKYGKKDLHRSDLITKRKDGGDLIGSQTVPPEKDTSTVEKETMSLMEETSIGACDTHSFPVIGYCKSCDQLACKDCLILEHFKADGDNICDVVSMVAMANSFISDCKGLIFIRLGIIEFHKYRMEAFKIYLDEKMYELNCQMNEYKIKEYRDMQFMVLDALEYINEFMKSVNFYRDRLNKLRCTAKLSFDLREISYSIDSLQNRLYPVQLFADKFCIDYPDFSYNVLLTHSSANEKIKLLNLISFISYNFEPNENKSENVNLEDHFAKVMEKTPKVKAISSSLPPEFASTTSEMPLTTSYEVVLKYNQDIMADLALLPGEVIIQSGRNIWISDHTTAQGNKSPDKQCFPASKMEKNVKSLQESSHLAGARQKSLPTHHNTDSAKKAGKPLMATLSKQEADTFSALITILTPSLAYIVATTPVPLPPINPKNVKLYGYYSLGKLAESVKSNTEMGIDSFNEQKLLHEKRLKCHEQVKLFQSRLNPFATFNNDFFHYSAQKPPSLEINERSGDAALSKSCPSQREHEASLGDIEVSQGKNEDSPKEPLRNERKPETNQWELEENPSKSDSSQRRNEENQRERGANGNAQETSDRESKESQKQRQGNEKKHEARQMEQKVSQKENEASHGEKGESQMEHETTQIEHEASLRINETTQIEHEASLRINETSQIEHEASLRINETSQIEHVASLRIDETSQIEHIASHRENEASHKEIETSHRENKKSQKKCEANHVDLTANLRENEASRREAGAMQMGHDIGAMQMEHDIGAMQMEHDIGAMQMEHSIGAMQMEHDIGAMQIEHDVDQRELGAIQREHEASQREHEASQREHEASQRELEASQRELEASQRELEASQRVYDEVSQRELESNQGETESSRGETDARQREHEARQREHEARQREHEARQRKYEESLRAYEESLRAYQESLGVYEESQSKYEENQKEYESFGRLHEAREREHSSSQRELVTFSREWDAIQVKHEASLREHEASLREHEASQREQEERQRGHEERQRGHEERQRGHEARQRKCEESLRAYEESLRAYEESLGVYEESKSRYEENQKEYEVFRLREARQREHIVSQRELVSTYRECDAVQMEHEADPLFIQRNSARITHGNETQIIVTKETSNLTGTPALGLMPSITMGAVALPLNASRETLLKDTNQSLTPTNSNETVLLEPDPPLATNHSEYQSVTNVPPQNSTTVSRPTESPEYSCMATIQSQAAALPKISNPTSSSQSRSKKRAKKRGKGRSGLKTQRTKTTGFSAFKNSLSLAQQVCAQHEFDDSYIPFVTNIFSKSIPAAKKTVIYIVKYMEKYRVPPILPATGLIKKNLLGKDGSESSFSVPSSDDED